MSLSMYHADSVLLIVDYIDVKRSDVPDAAHFGSTPALVQIL